MKVFSRAIVVSAMLSLTALAQNGNLTSELKVWLVAMQANGGETLRPADTVKPGDTLQYTAVYTNAGARPVSRLVANLPIPQGSEYVGASAVPAGALASLDGVAFAPEPLKRKVRQADGKLVDVPVPLAEYRALRWPEQQLAAGASLSTSARVRIVSAVAGAEPASSISTAPAKR